MIFSIRISQQASGDIREARDWYEDQVSGLGEQFGRELDSVQAVRTASCDVSPRVPERASGIDPTISTRHLFRR